ncbi:alpha/beta hydrolase [Nonomuraea sp. NPDC050783]|uniref:alpha/beta hydrolase n=1 Tax=Nonomuraea sp. NPDC050783 TaxID=3154634 RepID=UPI003465ED4A
MIMPIHPRRSRARAGRVRRLLLGALVGGAVVGPMAGVVRPGAVPAPVPAPVPPLDASPAALAARYGAARAEILAAGRAAARLGHHRRASRLREMADPARRFLSFDGRDGGRAVEVFGEPATARRIAVLVPGAGVDLDRYGPLRGGALRLQDALDNGPPGGGPPGDGTAGDRAASGGAAGGGAASGGAVVVVWLGYAAPSSLSLWALGPSRADEAAPALRAFVRELRAARPGARISLLCHSYGSVVCGRAAPGLEVAALVLFGSPGAGVPDAAALRTRAAVWAGRTSGDWVGVLPHLSVELPFGTAGLGADPVAPGFGARVFAAGGGGHGDYLAAGSTALASIARIVSDG